MSLYGARIFMTGGAGFIGSHLVRNLHAAGARVTVYDNFSSGLWELCRQLLEELETTS
jgi:nucleoside-diphosphate-sugar epimerase